MRVVGHVVTSARRSGWYELMLLRGLDLRIGLAYDRHGRERTLTLSVPGLALVLLWQR